MCLCHVCGCVSVLCLVYWHRISVQPLASIDRDLRECGSIFDTFSQLNKVHLRRNWEQTFQASDTGAFYIQYFVEVYQLHSRVSITPKQFPSTKLHIFVSRLPDIDIVPPPHHTHSHKSQRQGTIERPNCAETFTCHKDLQNIPLRNLQNHNCLWFSILPWLHVCVNKE